MRTNFDLPMDKKARLYNIASSNPICALVLSGIKAEGKYAMFYLHNRNEDAVILRAAREGLDTIAGIVAWSPQLGFDLENLPGFEAVVVRAMEDFRNAVRQQQTGEVAN